MSELWAVQVAIFEKLNTVVGLPAFYDVVPENAVKPYGTFGSPINAPRNVMGARGARHSIILDWWSPAIDTQYPEGTRFAGNKDVAQMAKLAQAALDGRPLALEDGTMVLLRWRGDTYLPEPERNLRRVSQAYDVDTR